MTQIDLPRSSIDRSQASRLRLYSGSVDWRFAVAPILVGLALQALGHLNGDDSWFITFAEKYLDGFVPYVDMSDPNPPAAFLAYVPAVYFARIFGVRPECAVVLLTVLGAGVAIFLAAKILHSAHLLSAQQAPGALAVALYLALIVPAFSFAEREHFAFLALLPIAAVFAARSARRPVAHSSALLAGIGAGIAVAFKPYFLLPLALAGAGTLILERRRALRFLPEIATAAVVVLIYAAIVCLAFPAYLGIFWLALDVYAPVRDRGLDLLTSTPFLCNIVVLATLAHVARRGFIDARSRVCGFFSIGFLATFLIQGKGWSNHALPGLAFGLLALAAQLRFLAAPAVRAVRQQRSLAFYVFASAFCIAPFLFGATQLLSNGEEHPGLAAAVAEIGPPQPKLAALAEQLDFGHPLVRRLGGTWIGRQNSLWISWGVKYLRTTGPANPAVEARRRAYFNDDLTVFAADIRNGRPDILLVESAQLRIWARNEPVLSGLFDSYVLVGRAGDVEIWRPRAR